MSEAPVKIGMKPSHPGEFIRIEILDELGLSVSKAAEVLGVRRATISDLINGHAALSPEMAIRLSKAFGGTAESWVRMQAAYDLWQAEQKADQIDVQRFHPQGPV
jgi:addiction module HigA family antidote